MNNKHLSDKIRRLGQALESFGSLAVAFSGGVDSSFLLAFAHTLLKNNVQALVAKSPVFSEHEENQALGFTRNTGIICHTVETDLMNVHGFVSNDKDRCYHCKKALFGLLDKKRRDLGLEALAHGVNTDDLGDYRPGLLAAEELGVVSPLALAGFSKADIREASRMMGLETADRPQMACLATRIPYGSPVTLEKLKAVEDSEAFLRRLGFKGCRVRHHGDVARIETGKDDIPRFIQDDCRTAVSERLKELGFQFVALDLDGFTSGSMNRVFQSA